ncbi:MAG: response regulator [Dehalococcoidia bacterium]|nr:response regulator [Dehalococcoidia bacterium]
MSGEHSRAVASRVLVVDDEAAVRSVLVRALVLWGYEVDAAHDGEAALAHLSRLPDGYACVLLDLTMPGIGGEATYRELKQIKPDVPVVLMSGYAPEAAIASLSEHPPAGFLQKPFDIETLRATVQSALAI